MKIYFVIYTKLITQVKKKMSMIQVLMITTIIPMGILAYVISNTEIRYCHMEGHGQKGAKVQIPLDMEAHWETMKEDTVNLQTQQEIGFLITSVILLPNVGATGNGESKIYWDLQDAYEKLNHH